MDDIIQKGNKMTTMPPAEAPAPEAVEAPAEVVEEVVEETVVEEVVEEEPEVVTPTPPAVPAFEMTAAEASAAAFFGSLAKVRQCEDDLASAKIAAADQATTTANVQAEAKTLLERTELTVTEKVDALDLAGVKAKSDARALEVLLEQYQSE